MSRCHILVTTYTSLTITSAGGGGKSKHRKAKIEAKNERLEGQRKRAAEQLQQDKAKKAEIKENGGNNDFAGVHPSRLSRMG